MSKKVAVVFGGISNENEISVITGTMTCNVLAEGGMEVLPVYISRQGEFFAGAELAKIATFRNLNLKKFMRAVFAQGGAYLYKSGKKPKKFVQLNCVVNCCHGGWGEGGGLAGLCAAAQLPLAGAGMFESAAFMDKYLTKIVLAGLNVRTVPYFYLRPGEKFEGECAFPLIVKPATLGSSIGVRAVHNAEELAEALDTAFIFDGGAVVEKYLVDRRDVNCAAYMAGDEVVISPCEEVLSAGEILSFEDKYRGGGRSKIPADIGEEAAEEICTITRKVYKRLNMRGIVRLDFIISEGLVYLSEINTVPGSLAYYLFCNSFKQFYTLLEGVILQAERDFAASRKKLVTTDILQNLPQNAAKLRK